MNCIYWWVYDFECDGCEIVFVSGILIFIQSKFGVFFLCCGCCGLVLFSELFWWDIVYKGVCCIVVECILDC